MSASDKNPETRIALFQRKEVRRVIHNRPMPRLFLAALLLALAPRVRAEFVGKCSPTSARQRKQAQAKNVGGMDFYRRQLWEDAREGFRAAAELDCGYLIARTNLASVLSRMRRFADATEVLMDAFALDPKKTLEKLRTDADYAELKKDEAFSKSCVSLWLAGYYREGTDLESAGVSAEPRSPAQVLELIKALGDKNPDAVAGAMDGLSLVCPPPAQAVAPLIGLLADRRKVDRLVGEGMPGHTLVPLAVFAEYRLMDIGAPALPALADALKNDPRAAVRSGCAASLGLMASSSGIMVRQRPPLEVIQNALLPAASDKEATVRESAMRALVQIYPATVATIGAMRRGLKDSDTEVRCAAAESLGGLMGQSKDAVPDLIAVLDDPQAKVRKSAADALKAIGTPEAVQASRLLK